MDRTAVSWALDQGAPVSCATCRWFHEGNMRCGKSECGGPAVGRDFPDYDGPIPREKFIERCLVCGDNAIKFHIIVGEGKTNFALCKRHRGVYAHVGAPKGKVHHPVTLVALP